MLGLARGQCLGHRQITGSDLSLLPGSHWAGESWVQVSWAFIPALIPAYLLWDLGQVLSLSKSSVADQSRADVMPEPLSVGVSGRALC